MTDRLDQPTTVIEALAAALLRAGAYNKDDQARPAAVLWPDRERQWEPLLPQLRTRLPILTLGAFDPDAKRGPAYWLRYALANGTREIAGNDGSERTPILYLPGLSKAELRAVEECPRPLQPIAELQYRGIFWTHRNGRDWTVTAFLQSGDGGLGIDVGTDAATKEALQQALGHLADLPVARLRREAPLRAPFFHSLLTPDEARSLLEWLDEPDRFHRSASPEVWSSFCSLARKAYGFDPERDGEVTAAALLGGREGRWNTVWERFQDAPAKYPNLPDLLRRARPSGNAQLSLFGGGTSDTWPQDNEAAEERLRGALAALANCGPVEARLAIAALDQEHGPRRGWVWSDLGAAPLAQALTHLAAVATVTERAPGGATMEAVIGAYADWGWLADAGVIAALAAVELSADVKAVGAAIGAVYRPWLDEAARAFQTGVATTTPITASVVHDYDVGTCVLFADGLRLDTGRHLAGLLDAGGGACTLTWRVCALPAVTPTAKPAASPVAHLLGPGKGLETVVAASGTRLTAEGMRKLLTEMGWQVLRGDEVGDPVGRGWTEAGAIDSYGHGHGWKLSHHLPAELRGIATRVADLLGAGWRRVTIITDHGWLLLPGGLPKAELPEHLTEIRKGRCARLKPDATTSEPTVPWFWDPEVRIAVAHGIASYEAGKEYEHGGLSPQECVVPVLTVTASAATEQAAIAGVTWKGLRCGVTVSGARPGLVLDVRTKAGDPASSIAESPKPTGSDGSGSLVVEDEDREGDAAHVVLLNEEGRVLTQVVTTVGG